MESACVLILIIACNCRGSYFHLFFRKLLIICRYLIIGSSVFFYLISLFCIFIIFGWCYCECLFLSYGTVHIHESDITMILFLAKI